MDDIIRWTALTQDEIVIVSTNIGFAIAIVKAFTERPGVTGQQVREALERLDAALAIIGKRND